MLSHDISPVPAVGTEAPDFTLISSDKEEVTLSSYRGKQHVLIAFFPLAFTSTCTQEMCSFTEDFDQFASKDVAILPISVDSKDSLREYKKQVGTNAVFLSDFKRVVSSLYGVLMLDRYYANRSYFLVDKSGVLRWVHVEQNPSHRRENSEILAEIAKL